MPNTDNEQRIKAEEMIEAYRLLIDGYEFNEDTHSDGLVCSLDFLIHLAKDGELFTNGEKSLTWNESSQSKFIESMLIGMPMQPLFLRDRRESESDRFGKLEVKDGAQRLLCIARFMKNELVLRDLDLLSCMNGFTYQDLLEDRKHSFGLTPVRLIVFDRASGFVERQFLQEWMFEALDKWAQQWIIRPKNANQEALS